MIYKLRAADKDDLLWIGKALAGLVFTTKLEQQALEERFLSMGNVLKHSWVYQEVKQEGKQEGLQKGEQLGNQQGQIIALTQSILWFVELRYPSLLPLAQDVLARATTPDQLQTTQKQLYLANSVEEVREALETHNRNA